MKNIFANLKLSSYQDILSNDGIQYYLQLNHLKKEELYFDKLIFNDLRSLKQYLDKPSDKELQSLLRDASYPISIMDQHKSLLFFYFADKGLVSFDIKQYSGIPSNSVSNHNYYLKTPSNNIECLFSHILTSYIKTDEPIDSPFLMKARENKDYLLTCFEFLCDKTNQEEWQLIQGESLYYWQNINLFFQETYKDDIIQKMILPLVKHGLEIDYLKNPLFIQAEAFPFIKHIDEIIYQIEKNQAETEKNYLDNCITNPVILHTPKKNKL